MTSTKILELSERYAKSVFELAEKDGKSEALKDELASLTSVLQEKPQLMNLFQNPLLSRQEKFALIEGLRPERSSLLERFLMLLVAKRRVDLLPSIVMRLQGYIDRKRGVEEVVIITARPVDEEAKPLFQKKLEALTGKKVVSVYKTDKSLLGGVQIRVGNRSIDGSVRRKLQELESRLKQTKV